VLAASVLALDHDAGGAWVRRTAESVLLTCWPPAPLARNVSTRTSGRIDDHVARVVGLGITATVAAEVWMRPLGLGGRHALHAWPPDSNLSFE
jgi:hypothetical protein